MASVRIAHLTKSFHARRNGSVRAVNGVSFELGNELLALVGPSGSGKTTILRLIAGLDEPDGGTIEIGGRSLEGVPAQDRDVAMVFQSPALYPHLTAFENMAFGLSVRHVARAEIRDQVGQAADLLGLTALLERKPMELSGGERQKVALGRAIVRRPKLFLLDEPLSNLDSPGRARLRNEIARLQTALDTPMIYVTHDQAEALRLGDRAVVLHEGAVQQAGEPLAIYERPANLFVAGFIGSPPMNLFPGTAAVEESRPVFRAGALVLPLPPGRAEALVPGSAVVLGLRPEHILAAAGPAAADLPAVDATVELVEPTGPQTYYHLSARSQRFIASAPGGTPRIAPGKVTACFQMSEAHYFDAGSGRRIE